MPGMAMRESVDIAADAETVWALVADPVRHAEWNEKIISSDRSVDGPVTLGEKFTMIYRLSGRDRESRVEVVECDPPRRLTLEHRSMWKGREHIVTESCEISDIAYGVTVTTTIDMSRALPLWARGLIWFISTFGKPVAEPGLHKLRRLAEGPLSGSS